MVEKMTFGYRMFTEQQIISFEIIVLPNKLLVYWEKPSLGGSLAHFVYSCLRLDFRVATGGKCF